MYKWAQTEVLDIHGEVDFESPFFDGGATAFGVLVLHYPQRRDAEHAWSGCW